VSAQPQRIDQVVRLTLGVSLAVAFVLLCVGIVLTLAGRGGVPTTVGGARAALRDVRALEPDGFYVLGLLVVIVTPFVRVVGSAVTFLVERDWVYVAVTVAVLVVMIVTVTLGVV
jgi:uncharacterized membrane protein